MVFINEDYFEVPIVFINAPEALKRRRGRVVYRPEEGHLLTAEDYAIQFASQRGWLCARASYLHGHLYQILHYFGDSKVLMNRVLSNDLSGIELSEIIECRYQYTEYGRGIDKGVLQVLRVMPEKILKKIVQIIEIQSGKGCPDIFVIHPENHNWYYIEVKSSFDAVHVKQLIYLKKVLHIAPGHAFILVLMPQKDSAF